MPVTRVRGIVCPECEAFIPEKDVPENVAYFQCGECKEVHKDRALAVECCKA